MRSIIPGFLISFLLLAGSTAAQIPVKNQPAPGWCKQSREIMLKKTPTVPALLALKASRPAPDLDRALREMDWLDAGSYAYRESKAGVYYGVKQPQLSFHRYQQDGGQLSFSCYIYDDGREQTTHTNFAPPPEAQWAVRIVNNVYYIEETSRGEKALFPIIQYQDGVLIVDISEFGRIGEAPAFRSVLVSVPRAFAWQYGEKVDPQPSKPSKPETSKTEPAKNSGPDAVQVEWKGKWYPAKILKQENGKFFIHYEGFDSSWDEWVTESRIKRK